MAKTTPTPKHAHSDDHSDHDHAGHDHSGHNHDHSHSHDDTNPTLQLVTPNSKISIKLPWKVVEPEYQKNLIKLSQNLQASGFRKGKVPAHLAESMIDPIKLIEPVLQVVLPPAYSEALQKDGKRPISNPEFDPIHVGKNVDWEIDVYFAEEPTIELGEYKKLVKKAKPLAAKEIEETSKALKEAATKAATDAKNESQADKPNLAAPEPKELSEEDKEEINLRAIYQELALTLHPSVPEILVRQEVNREIDQLMTQLKPMNISFDRYLEIRKISREQLHQEMATISLSRLQLEFLLAKIAQQEKLTVDDAEIDSKLAELVKEPLTHEQLHQHPYRSYVFSTLLKSKVNKFLLSL